MKEIVKLEAYNIEQLVNLSGVKDENLDEAVNIALKNNFDIQGKNYDYLESLENAKIEIEKSKTELEKGEKELEEKQEEFKDKIADAESK